MKFSIQITSLEAYKKGSHIWIWKMNKEKSYFLS